jgi:hypothetical protein
MTRTRQRDRKYDPVWPVALLLLASMAIGTAFGFAFVRALEMAAW